MSARPSEDPREATGASAGAGEGTGTGVARTTARARPRIASHAQEEGPRQANSHLEVEEKDIGKTLSVKDGKLGFVTAKGFIEKKKSLYVCINSLLKIRTKILLFSTNNLIMNHIGYLCFQY